MAKEILIINDLHIASQDKEIVKGVSLTLSEGEVHVIMGPNGSGKSTLLSTIMGSPAYTITKGEVKIESEVVNDVSPTERARKGLFLAFQYPHEVEGITLGNFIRTAKNAHTIARDPEAKPIGLKEFADEARKALSEVGLPKEFVGRGLNQGFSGGEKKRAEIAQMILLQPKVALIDEIDSGLDVDALREVAQAINALKEKGMTVLLVTHYARILEYITPTHVHIMGEGVIKASGDSELVVAIEKDGYEQYLSA